VTKQTHAEQVLYVHVTLDRTFILRKKKLKNYNWDIIEQGTASLTTITAVVKQTEGDKYVTSSLVLPFVHTCMKILAEDVSIKQCGARKA
jgi:hypothetical protein